VAAGYAQATPALFISAALITAGGLLAAKDMLKRSAPA
jgi:hypothetical protein